MPQADPRTGDGYNKQDSIGPYQPGNNDESGTEKFTTGRGKETPEKTGTTEETKDAEKSIQE